MTSAELAACLTDEFLATCRELPYPAGEPTVPPQPVWREPPQWQVLPVEHVPLYLALHVHERFAVHHDGQIGFARQKPTRDVLSPDERGYRSVGGEEYFVPARKFQSTSRLLEAIISLEQQPEFVAIAAQLHEQVLSRDVRHAAHPAALDAWRKACGEWWAWWQNLDLATKVRVVLQAEKGRLARVVRTTFIGRVQLEVLWPSEDQRRYTRSFRTLFPYSGIEKSSGTWLLTQAIVAPGDLIGILLAEGFSE